jgi:hypothetical protein
MAPRPDRPNVDIETDDARPTRDDDIVGRATDEDVEFEDIDDIDEVDDEEDQEGFEA